MKKVLLIFLLGIFGFFGIGLSVYFMSDLQKAKTLLFFLGINEEVDNKYVEFQKIIKNETFTTVFTFADLPIKYLELIEKLNQNESNEFSTLLRRNFAIGNERWNATCIMDFNLPIHKLNYSMYSNNHFIISYFTGGFGMTISYSIFKTNGDTMIYYETVDGFLHTIYDTILLIHFKREIFKDLERYNSGPILENENQ